MADIARILSVLLGGTGNVLGSVDSNRRLKDSLAEKNSDESERKASAAKKEAASTASIQSILAKSRELREKGFIAPGQADMVELMAGTGDTEKATNMLSTFGKENVSSEREGREREVARDYEYVKEGRASDREDARHQRGLQVEAKKDKREEGQRLAAEERAEGRIRSRPEKAGEKFRYKDVEGDDGFKYEEKINKETDEVVSRRKIGSVTGSDPMERMKNRKLRDQARKGIKPAEAAKPSFAGKDPLKLKK